MKKAAAGLSRSRLSSSSRSLEAVPDTSAGAAGGAITDGAGQPSSETRAEKRPTSSSWVEAYTDSGEVFYHNPDTGESVWTKPQEPSSESGRNSTVPTTPGSASNMLEVVGAAADEPDTDDGIADAITRDRTPEVSVVDAIVVDAVVVDAVVVDAVVVEPQVVPVPEDEWEEFCTPEGRPYYLNKLTGVTSWEKVKAEPGSRVSSSVWWAPCPMIVSIQL
jgi:outer membrane protein assembly factor BamB